VTAPPDSVEKVADAWASCVWSSMRTAHNTLIQVAESAREKQRADEKANLTDEETAALTFVTEFETGFCIGGHYGSERTPAAYELRLELNAKEPPKPKPITPGRLSFWGVPNMFRRLLHGVDWRILEAILNAVGPDGSKLWTGSEDDLYNLAFEHAMIVHPGLPIREAVDLVHFSIAATIKALKFSHYADPTCGGPIGVSARASTRGAEARQSSMSVRAYS